MTFKREQEIRIEGKEFYIIEVITYENEQYIYTQEIEDDELVDTYTIYKYDSVRNAMIQIKEQGLLEVLLKLFTDSINKTLQGNE